MLAGYIACEQSRRRRASGASGGPQSRAATLLSIRTHSAFGNQDQQLATHPASRRAKAAPGPLPVFQPATDGMTPRAGESQEQKRQRLREAGRRKLEEFKRRNVESLPTIPQLGTRSFSGNGLAPLTGPPMAAMAVVGRGAAGHMNLAELSRALPSDKHTRGSTRAEPDGSLGARGSLLRPAASADALHDAAAGAEPANGHQHDSAPVSRASSTNSAILQGSPGIRPTHRPIQTPPKTPRMTNSNGDALPPLTLEQANGSAEHANVLGEPGADNPLVVMLLQQVKTMKDEKQELLRVIEELRAENGNLQELVGFLTENSDMAAHTDDIQDGYGSYPSNDYGSDLYVPDDGEVIIPEEHCSYEHEAVEMLHE